MRSSSDWSYHVLFLSAESSEVGGKSRNLKSPSRRLNVIASSARQPGYFTVKEPSTQADIFSVRGFIQWYISTRFLGASS